MKKLAQVPLGAVPLGGAQKTQPQEPAKKPVTPTPVGAQPMSGGAPKEQGAAYKKPSGGSVSGRPTEEERQQVGLMQNILADFAKAVSQEKATLTQALSSDRIGATKTSEVDLQNWAGAMSDTGGVKTFDGKWGGKTRKGLDIINVVAQRARNTSKYKGPSVEVDKDWLKNPANEIIEAAKKNAQIISTLMGGLGLGKYVSPEVKKQTGTTSVDDIYDTIPNQISKENMLVAGELPVRPVDLSSLPAFFTYIEGLNIVATANKKTINELVKLAEIIKESNLIKTAQLRANPYEETAKPAKGMTVGQFEYALKWMFQRAYRQYLSAQRPEAGKSVDQSEVKKKAEYANRVRALYQQFRDWRGERKVTDFITFYDFDGAEAGSAYRKSQPDQDYDGVSAVPSGEDKVVKALKNPPFKDMINITELSRKWRTQGSEYYADVLASGWLNLEQLRGADPARLWMQLIGGKYSPAPGRLAAMLEQMQKDLTDIFSNWQRDLGKLRNHPRVQEVISQQNDMLEDWLRALQWVKRTAQRGKSGV